MADSPRGQARLVVVDSAGEPGRKYEGGEGWGDGEGGVAGAEGGRPEELQDEHRRDAP